MHYFPSDFDKNGNFINDADEFDLVMDDEEDNYEEDEEEDEEDDYEDEEDLDKGFVTSDEEE